ncbi:radial spoke head protein 3 homolog [Argonauta hians]
MSALAQKRNGSEAGPYSFSSQPRVVSHRKKYQKTPDESPVYNNIMYDQRVVRGNTYALSTIPAQAQPDPLEAFRREEVKRRAKARRRAKEQFDRLTPEPVPGRKHVDVQTELYLEEITNRAEEADVDVQTDYFLDRPPSPLFIPYKTGIDVETQILEGELFDFNTEVQAILEVLVGKTVEQSLIEVLEEEELANLRQQQRYYIELRNAELAEQQRLQEQNRRKVEEKTNRMAQQLHLNQKESETAEKISAMTFARSYLRDLIPTVFALLSDNGYFYDIVERDIEDGFLPWLLASVNKQLTTNKIAAYLLDTILEYMVAERNYGYGQLFMRLLKEEKERKNPAFVLPEDKEEEATESERSASSKSPNPDADETKEPEEELE